MLKSIPAKSVIYPSSLYQRLDNKAYKAFPNEAGGFLLAPPTFDKDIVEIADNYSSRTSVGSPTTFTITIDCLMKAHQTAAKKGLIVAGMWHSHPWRILPPGLTYLSHEDVELLSQMQLPFSMVIGIAAGFFNSTFWRYDYPAPYTQIIETPARRGRACRDYIYDHYRKNKRTAFWRKHFGNQEKAVKLSP